MVNIGTDRRCLARHGEIIRHNNNYPPTPGPHSMKTDSDGQADLALRYVLLLRGSGTPRYRPSSGCPSGGSSSTTISTLLIAARRSACRELSASSIASSNGSLNPAPNPHPSPQWCQNRCWDRDGFFFGGFVAAVAELTELAALWPGDVVVEIVLLPPQLHVPAATVTSSRKMSLRGCRPTEVSG